MILDRSKEIEPKIGDVYRVRKTYKCEFRILKKLDERDFRIRNIETGWEVTAHGVTCFDNGTIDWDSSTEGQFTAGE